MGPRTLLRALIVTALALGPGAAVAAADPPAAGQTTTGTVTSNGVEFPYLLHTPGSHDSDEPMPLLVMVHGAQTTAQVEQRLTSWDGVADKDGFAVLYPEVDAADAQAPGPLAQSWNFYDPRAYFRGNNDTAAIALMTRTVMDKLRIDPERVYLVGISGGGLVAAGGAGGLPGPLAPVGDAGAGGFAGGFWFAGGVGIPVQASAQLAFTAMGSY